MDKQGVAIIGGKGRLGSWFCRFFEDRGWRVSAIDGGGQHSHAAIASCHAVLVFAVPHVLAPAVIAEWGGVLTADHLLIDLSSVKTDTTKACSTLVAETLLVHPMWSPQVASMSGQTMVVCVEGRHGERTREVLEMFTQAGVRMQRLSVEDHDKVMALVQVVNHAALLAVGLAQGQSGIPVSVLSDSESPIYRMMSAMLGRMLSHQPELYADIALSNPYGAEALTALRESVQAVEDAVKRGDHAAYLRLFESVRVDRQAEISSAVSDSAVMVEALARIRSGSNP
jgi:prephenate dehydrogenase